MNNKMTKTNFCLKKTHISLHVVKLNKFDLECV